MGFHRDKTTTPVPHRVRYPTVEDLGSGSSEEGRSGPGQLGPDDYELIPTHGLLNTPHGIDGSHPLLGRARPRMIARDRLYLVDSGQLVVARAEDRERLGAIDLAAFGLWPTGVAVVGDFVYVTLRDGGGIGFREP